MLFRSRLAGRAYIAAARTAADANPSGRLPNIDDWMRPAVTRGLWIATASGATILLIGFAALRVAGTGGQIPVSPDQIAASRRRRSEPPRATPCA